MTITVPSGGFPFFKLFVNQADYTQYVLPEQLRYYNKLQRGGVGQLEFHMKDMPDTFDIRGGQRIDFYLPYCEYPLFTGLCVESQPVRHSTANWTIRVMASGWESVFYRKPIYTAFRNMTFEQAANSVLADSDQTYPSVLATSVISSAGEDGPGVLFQAMPFYSVSGIYPGDVFDLIAEMASCNWRVVPVSVSEMAVEFYDPNLYTASRPFLFSNTSQSFRWTRFEPRFSVGGIINSQTVRGATSPSAIPDVALFRGDNLNSKFPLPVKPYSNLLRVEFSDSFDSSALNEGIWLETDTVDNKVYQTGDGFLQLEPAGQWAGVQSRIITERSNTPTAVFDLTWLVDGVVMFGFTGLDAIPVPSYAFIDAGIYVDPSNVVYCVANGGLFLATDLVLDADTQYRFRVTAYPDGGCRIEYQTDAETYTRSWTVLGESVDGNFQDLQVALFNYSADLNVAQVKCVNPYLGIKLEVDRGQGFVTEQVGVYPIDDDLDAVIEDEQTVSFFGSNPGPSTIPPAPSAKEFTMSDLGNDIGTVVGGHGISSGSLVRFSTTGTAPAGLTNANTYYFRGDNYTNFTLYDTQAHALAGGTTGRVDITTNGTGIHSIIPTAWEDKDSDYKNVRVTYSRGVVLQATYRDIVLVDIVADLFGDGDDGVREGQLLSDSRLTSYYACLSQARSIVTNRNNILSGIRAETNWSILRAASMAQPYLGDCGRFEVLIDKVGYTLSGDIPLVQLEVTALRGGNDFVFRFEAGYITRGLKSVLRTLLDSGHMISMSDAEVAYRSGFISDTMTFSDSVDTESNSNKNWGDSRIPRDGWRWNTHKWNSFFVDTGNVEIVSDWATPTVS